MNLADSANGESPGTTPGQGHYSGDTKPGACYSMLCWVGKQCDTLTLRVLLWAYISKLSKRQLLEQGIPMISKFLQKGHELRTLLFVFIFLA